MFRRTNLNFIFLYTIAYISEVAILKNAEQLNVMFKVTKIGYLTISRANQIIGSIIFGTFKKFDTPCDMEHTSKSHATFCSDRCV